ncbi:MAG TPA: hypothetical protein DCQ06_14535 [Myxococcales bacterium]|nr:hypothetical protein [Myxococcales bacterium]
MRRSTQCRSLLLCIFILFMSGCHIFGGDPVKSPTDEQANSLFTGKDAGEVETAGETGSCDCVSVGDWYRFDAIQIDAIDNGPHNVIIVLNPLWKQDVENLELNFYLQVTAVSGTEITFEVVNGARVDGSLDEVCLLPYTSATLVHPRDKCSFGESKPSAMNVYAGTETHKKNCAPTTEVPHSIAVRNAVLTAKMSADCSRIVEGKVVSGALGQAALEKTCTCVNPGKRAEECQALDATFQGNDCDGCNSKYQNLKTLLQNFGELKWACEVAGKPAACLEASFSAVKIDAAPPECGAP